MEISTVSLPGLVNLEMAISGRGSFWESKTIYFQNLKLIKGKNRIIFAVGSLNVDHHVKQIGFTMVTRAHLRAYL